MKILSTISNSFIKMSVKQKVTVGICSVIVIGGGILGLYQMLPSGSTPNEIVAEDSKNVTIQAITDSAQAVADKLTNTPAETAPIETTVANQTEGTVVSNAATIETTINPENIYIAEDGAHYESEPVYSEPTHEEPVYEEPASDGGWDGDLGAVDAGDFFNPDEAANYGSGISN